MDTGWRAAAGGVAHTVAGRRCGSRGSPLDVAWKRDLRYPSAVLRLARRSLERCRNFAVSEKGFAPAGPVFVPRPGRRSDSLPCPGLADRGPERRFGRWEREGNRNWRGEER